MNTEISIPEIPVSRFRHYLRRTGNPLTWNQQLSRGSPPDSPIFPQGAAEVGLASTAREAHCAARTSDPSGSRVKLRNDLDDSDDVPVERREVFGGNPQLLVCCAADGLDRVSA